MIRACRAVARRPGEGGDRGMTNGGGGGYGGQQGYQSQQEYQGQQSECFISSFFWLWVGWSARGGRCKAGAVQGGAARERSRSEPARMTILKDSKVIGRC